MSAQYSNARVNTLIDIQAEYLSSASRPVPSQSVPSVPSEPDEELPPIVVRSAQIIEALKPHNYFFVMSDKPVRWGSVEATALVMGDSYQICLRFVHDTKKNRLEISFIDEKVKIDGDYRSLYWQRVYKRLPSREITVSAERSAESIAKDVVKRLIKPQMSFVEELKDELLKERALVMKGNEFLKKLVDYCNSPCVSYNEEKSKSTGLVEKKLRLDFRAGDWHSYSQDERFSSYTETATIRMTVPWSSLLDLLAFAAALHDKEKEELKAND